MSSGKIDNPELKSSAPKKQIKLRLAAPRMGGRRLREHLPTYGEVVATARAIGRTLESHGLDWHDLAAAVCGKAQSRQSCRMNDELPLWSELDSGHRLAWLDAILPSYWLSRWEHEFALDIRAKLRTGRRFSYKQQIVLNRLIIRAWDRGVGHDPSIAFRDCPCPFGGEVSGLQVLAPGPWHSRKERNR
jgi:hypothetical protein